MHLIEGPDFGHSMIYYVGKLEKRRQDSNPRPHDYEASAQPPSNWRDIPLCWQKYWTGTAEGFRGTRDKRPDALEEFLLCLGYVTATVVTRFNKTSKPLAKS